MTDHHLELVSKLVRFVIILSLEWILEMEMYVQRTDYKRWHEGGIEGSVLQSSKHAIQCFNLDDHRHFISLRCCDPDIGMSIQVTFQNLLLTFFSKQLVADLITPEQFQNWLANTDADITYVVNPSSSPSAMR